MFDFLARAVAVAVAYEPDANGIEMPIGNWKETENKLHNQWAKAASQVLHEERNS